MNTTKKTAVVTGGAGFIGSNLTKALLKEGHEVRVVDNLSGGKREKVPEGAVFHQLDILDGDGITGVFRGADVVFHEAALPRVPFSIEHPVESHEANVDGTLSVLVAARTAGVRRVVFAASASAYGNQEILPAPETAPVQPVNPYGLHKYIGERYMTLFANVYGLQTVSLRYFNVYGPGMDPEGPYALAVGRFISQKMRGEPLTIVGDGTQTRDFTNVRDIVRANILAATSQKVGKGEVINIGSGRNVSVNTLAELIAPGEPRASLPPRAEAHDSKADWTLAKKLLGWEPEVTLEEGIAELKKEYNL